MSWASVRRAEYLFGVILFFVVIIGGPLLYWGISAIPPACPVGTMRPAGISSGACSELDPRYLQSVSVMWARAFRVRADSYTAVAYVQNSNPNAGVQQAHYKMGLYDGGNVLIAEREGEMFIMPGSITPVLETGIYTGNRDVVHTYFQITDASPIWKEATNPAADIKVSNESVTGLEAAPRVEARVRNASLDSRHNISFVITLFDTTGNAFAASGTALQELAPGATAQIAFTWPQPFPTVIGRIDIIPLLQPESSK